MQGLPPTLEKLVDAFQKLPGIGNKTAHRLGLHVLKTDKDTIQIFSDALMNVKNKISFCEICSNFAESNTCEICSDEKRDHGLVCVVEKPADIFLFEKTGYKGVYHVLGGLLSPLDGIGPDELNFNSLKDRIDSINEIIMATNASIEGDTTSLYLSRLFESSDIKISRLARGLPVGGHIEYVDEATLASSLEERVKM